MQSLSHLSDDSLLHELRTIVGSHRRATAELIVHLGEVDARRLHVDKGFSSLFGYCVEELRFSEDEAYRRIEAARLARRFPSVSLFLEAGTISLTVLALLKLHLTDENHGELLAGVSGASVRRAKEWLAARFPRPDVPSVIRKLPERRRASVTLPLPDGGTTLRRTNGVPNRAEPAPDAESPALTRGASVQNGAGWGLRTAALAPAARIEPLSSDRFLVKFTASRTLKDKLELARDLMRHANPGGDLVVVLDRAVDLLIAELEKKKLGRTNKPSKKPRPAKDSHVTRTARREVVARDGFRCSFVAHDGRRCESQAFLEFDHQTPKGRGGNSRADNVRLLCRAHNRWAAEHVYGKAHVSDAISGSRNKERPLMVHDGFAP